MQRGLAQFCALVAALALCLRASGATDPFLQLNSPILTNGQVQFTLTGETDVPYVIESSTNTQNWSAVITNNGTASTRLITLPASNSPTFYRAGRELLPVFPAAIVAKQSVNLRGANVVMMSYDSADPMHDDPVNPDERKAGGDVFCEGDILATNAIIFGKVKSGGTLIATNAIIGDLAWTNRGTAQLGWYQNDYRFVLPDVVPPFATGLPLPPTLGTGSNDMIFVPGDYYLNGNFRKTGIAKTILVTGGSVRLYVTGDFEIPIWWEIKIEPGSTFRVYVGESSGTNTFGRLGFVNIGSMDISAFQYYGLPNNRSVVWGGDDLSKGVIYAPQADVTLGGGGIDVHLLQGACVANSIVINGRFWFQFDENLKRNGPFR